MVIMFGRNHELPLTSDQRAEIISEQTQAQLKRLQSLEPPTVEEVMRKANESHPPHIPYTEDRRSIPVIHTRRDIREGLDRIGHMVGNIEHRAVAITEGIYERGLYDAAKHLVKAAQHDQNPQSLDRLLLKHFLHVWQVNNEYGTQMEVYNTYRTRGMDKPKKKSHLLEQLGQVGIEATVFRELEDHLGNFIRPHISKLPLVNKLLELGIDVTAGKVFNDIKTHIEKGLSLQVAVVLAQENPALMEEEVRTLVTSAYDSLVSNPRFRKEAQKNKTLAEKTQEG